MTPAGRRPPSLNPTAVRSRWREFPSASRLSRRRTNTWGRSGIPWRQRELPCSRWAQRAAAARLAGGAASVRCHGYSPSWCVGGCRWGRGWQEAVWTSSSCRPWPSTRCCARSARRGPWRPRGASSAFLGDAVGRPALPFFRPQIECFRPLPRQMHSRLLSRIAFRSPISLLLSSSSLFCQNPKCLLTRRLQQRSRQARQRLQEASRPYPQNVSRRRNVRILLARDDRADAARVRRPGHVGAGEEPAEGGGEGDAVLRRGPHPARRYLPPDAGLQVASRPRPGPGGHPQRPGRLGRPHQEPHGGAARRVACQAGGGGLGRGQVPREHAAAAGGADGGSRRALQPAGPDAGGQGAGAGRARVRGAAATRVHREGEEHRGSCPLRAVAAHDGGVSPKKPASCPGRLLLMNHRKSAMVGALAP
mmetsp:Transcript_60757/g.162448  ORF Transcript_60757/g.162448 Transcript_60757/m.162448 type:complete len:420 (-) Transcript_60757:145-1404(-)